MIDSSIEGFSSEQLSMAEEEEFITIKNMATKVVISPNPVKTSERIDFKGNVINPRTKQVIVPKEPEYIPPPPATTPPNAPESPTTQEQPKVVEQDISAQIAQAEANLAKLKQSKEAKIAELEEQLKKLKQ